MLIPEYITLIDHYIERATYHATQFLFGDKKWRPYHQSQERNFDKLLRFTIDKMGKDKEVWKK